MNDLIKVNYDGDQPTVSGRDLHAYLEIGTAYKDWFPRMCEYGFSDGTDYTPLIFEHPQNHQPFTDHALLIPMAKEIAMIQRSDKGRQVRQYFIRVEESWNSPEMVMSRALRLADGRIKQLQASNARLTADNAIMQPKAEYFDELVDRALNISLRVTAKELAVKERDFVRFLIDRKYLFRDKKGRLLPYAQYVDDLFVVKECYNDKTEWAGTQTLVTPKGRETFRLLYAKVA